MKIDTDAKKIESILTRGVEDVFIFEELKAKLLSGKKLIIKHGVDPTGTHIHLGRAATMRKLRAFQDLGHQVSFIIGDFTAQIGDPSDKLGKRPMLDKKAVLANLKNYIKEIGRVIDIKKAKFYYNSKWLGKLTFHEISQLAESFTVQQMLARRNFKDRFEKGEEISVREFLYPLMQGYDSVMLKSDVEIGGFDQLFNIKAGRVIQKYYGQPEQSVLTCQMLEGLDGRKMSTSWGNVINIDDKANDMYGKVMSVRDELIVKYFLLCTDLNEEEAVQIEKDLKSGANPKELKMRLAREIVKIYHGEKEALEAEEYFTSTFQNKEMPDEMPEIKANSGQPIGDCLVEAGVVASKAELRRLMTEGAVQIEGKEKITDINFPLTETLRLKIGKKKFVKIIV